MGEHDKMAGDVVDAPTRNISTYTPRDMAEENLWLKAALVCVLKQQDGDHEMPPSIFEREVDRIDEGSTRVDVFWDWGLWPPARIRISFDNEPVGQGGDDG